MDDDGSKTLDYREFKKGLADYGLNMEEEVRIPNLGRTPAMLVSCMPDPQLMNRRFGITPILVSSQRNFIFVCMTIDTKPHPLHKQYS